MRRVAATLLAAAALAGCDLLIGIDDFAAPREASPTGAGATGSGGGDERGGGGEGGAGDDGGAGGGVCTPRPCPDQTPSDAFGDGSLGPTWLAEVSSTITGEEIDGVLRFTVPRGPAARYASIVTAYKYDFRPCGALVRHDGEQLESGEVVHFLLAKSTEHRAGFVLNGSTLRLYYRKGTVIDESDMPFDRGAHQWWWLRIDDDMVTWLTSANGSCWTERKTRANGLDATLELDLGAGTGQATEGYVVEFDDVNLPP